MSLTVHANFKIIFPAYTLSWIILNLENIFGERTSLKWNLSNLSPPLSLCMHTHFAGVYAYGGHERGQLYVDIGSHTGLKSPSKLGWRATGLQSSTFSATSVLRLQVHTAAFSVFT